MALELLPGNTGWNTAYHAAYHDLESFYWVLLWVVLKHTALEPFPPDCRADLTPLRAFLNTEKDPTKMLAAKRLFLASSAPATIAVRDHAPLTELLRAFGALVVRQCGIKPKKVDKKRKDHEDSDDSSESSDSDSEDEGEIVYRNGNVIEYDEVLALFDAALERDDWPVGDAALLCPVSDVWTLNGWKTAKKEPEAESVPEDDTKRQDRVEEGNALAKDTKSKGSFVSATPAERTRGPPSSARPRTQTRKSAATDRAAERARPTKRRKVDARSETSGARQAAAPQTNHAAHASAMTRAMDARENIDIQSDGPAAGTRARRAKYGERPHRAGEPASRTPRATPNRA